MTSLSAHYWLPPALHHNGQDPTPSLLPFLSLPAPASCLPVFRRLPWQSMKVMVVKFKMKVVENPPEYQCCEIDNWHSNLYFKSKFNHLSLSQIFIYAAFCFDLYFQALWSIWHLTEKIHESRKGKFLKIFVVICVF